MAQDADETPLPSTAPVQDGLLVSDSDATAPESPSRVGIEQTTLGQAALVRRDSKLLQVDADKQGLSPAQLRSQRFPKGGPANSTVDADPELTPAQRRALRFPKQDSSLGASAGPDSVTPSSPSNIELFRAASEEAIQIVEEMQQLTDNPNPESTEPPEHTMYQLQRRLSEVMIIHQRTQPFENSLGLTEEEQIDWTNPEAVVDQMTLNRLARRFSALGRKCGRQPAAA